MARLPYRVFVAAQAGDYGTVSDWLADDAHDINAPERSRGWTLLHALAQGRFPDGRVEEYGRVWEPCAYQARRLLERGADPSPLDHDGNCPLHWAVA